MLKTIIVTDEYIQKNEHCCRTCPVSEAINVHLADGLYALTAGRISWICQDKDYIHIDLYLPILVSHWIATYDTVLGVVEPITFELEIPDSCLRQ